MSFLIGRFENDLKKTSPEKRMFVLEKLQHLDTISKKHFKQDLLDSTPVAAPSLLAEKVRKELSKISLLEFVIYMCEKMDESGVESFTTEYDYNDHHYTFSLKGRKNVE